MSRKILGVFLLDVGLGYPCTFKYAYVVELADTQDLGSCSVKKSAGSSPVISTSNYLTVAMLIYLSGRRLLMA